MAGRGGNRRLPPLHGEVREQVDLPASVESQSNPVGKKYVPPPPPPKPVPALALAEGLYGGVVRRRSPSPPLQRRVPARRPVRNLSSLHLNRDSIDSALPDWDDVCSVQDSEMTQSEGGGEELCSDDPDEYGDAASLLVDSFFFAAAKFDAEGGDTDVCTKDVAPIPKDGDAVGDHWQQPMLETVAAAAPSPSPPQRPLPKMGPSPPPPAATYPPSAAALAPAAPALSPPKREGPPMPTLDDLLGSPRGPYGESKAFKTSGRRPHRLEGSSRIPQIAR